MDVLKELKKLAAIEDEHQGDFAMAVKEVERLRAEVETDQKAIKMLVDSLRYVLINYVDDHDDPHIDEARELAMLDGG